MTLTELAAASGVWFGTSGARGLVREMSDEVCYAYTAGFIQYLESQGALPRDDRRIAIAGDLRTSSGRIMAAVARAVIDRGYVAMNYGRIPSPALAWHGMQSCIPTIMVTGSHIPDDRNGIKFTTARGEILKEDEAGILAQAIDLPPLFDEAGMLRVPHDIGPEAADAHVAYLQRWLDVFPHDCLHGARLGLYQHSAVGRDLLAEIYTALGAEVELLGRSVEFIPVDTEAIRAEDVRLAAEWAQRGQFDAILSTDGDGDRPLIADETGVWIRGDMAGILCARFCEAEVVVTPITCSTALEQSGWFRSIRRTRIGSPYVIAAMQQAVAEGAAPVVGYEANGGFLTATAVRINERLLPPLPTRDPVIVHLALLLLARREQKPLSALVAELPSRITVSDRLKNFPTERSRQLLSQLNEEGVEALQALWPDMGEVVEINRLDGLRVTFASGEIIHLRPSGNAPELRCYAEAATLARATELVQQTMGKLQRS